MDIRRIGAALRAAGLAVALAALALPALAVNKVKPGEVPELGPNEGYLLASVDTPWKLASVSIVARDRVFTSTQLSRLPEGGKLQLIVVPAGRYRWDRLEPFDNFYYALGKDSEFHFEVKPGEVNYAGDLVFRPRGWMVVDIHTANRGLSALDWLEATHPQIYRSHPFSYVGHYPDPFPAAYRKARGDIASIAANAPEPAPVPTPLTIEELWKPDRIDEVRLNPGGDLLAESTLDGRKWAIDLIDLKARKQVRLLEPPFPVHRLRWLGERTLLVTLDAGNDQHFVSAIHIRDGSAPEARTYEVASVPYEGDVVTLLPGNDREVIFLSHNRQGAANLHRLDVSSVEAMKDSENAFRKRLNRDVPSGLWIVDRAGEVRVVFRHDEKGTALLYGHDGQYEEVLRVDDDEPEFEPAWLSPDGELIYGYSEKDRGQRDLVVFDPRLKKIVSTRFSKPGVDVEGILSDRNGEPIGVTYHRGGLDISDYFAAIDGSIYTKLQGLFPGRSVTIIERDSAAANFILSVDASDQPGKLYHYDRANRRVAVIDEGMPWLAGKALGKAKVIHATGTDGLAIEAFLTMPPAVAGKAPLVVLAHGGPVGVADTLHFDPEVQFLASLGYAVLQVNFRGSDGYGKAHRDKGWAGFGTLIEEDIHAALEVVLASEPLDGTRVCAMGTSYGGYSSLVSAIRWPDRYRCVVTIAGVSDRPLLFTASDMSRNDDDRESLVEAMGDPRTQMDAMLATSPLYHAGDVRVPVLVVHGTADERVDYEHARRLVRMLALAGRPPVVVELKDAGHGIDTDEHRKRAWPVVAGFLAKYLKQ